MMAPSVPPEVWELILFELCLCKNISHSYLLSLRTVSRSFNAFLEPAIFRRPVILTSTTYRKFIQNPSKYPLIRSLDSRISHIEAIAFLKFTPNVQSIYFRFYDVPQSFTFPICTRENLVALTIADETPFHLLNPQKTPCEIVLLVIVSLKSLKHLAFKMQNKLDFLALSNVNFTASLKSLSINSPGGPTGSFKFFENQFKTLRHLQLYEREDFIDIHNVLKACADRLESLDVTLLKEHALPAFPRLRYFCLSYIHQDVGFLSNLAPLIGESQDLEALELNTVDLGGKLKPGRLKNLQKLSFVIFSEVDDSFLTLIGESQVKVMFLFPTDEENWVGELKLVEIFSNSLRILELQFFDTKTLGYLQNCPNLTSLNIYTFPNIVDLLIFQSPSLQYLCLHLNVGSPDVFFSKNITQLGVNCPNLKGLYIFDYLLSQEEERESPYTFEVRWKNSTYYVWREAVENGLQLPRQPIFGAEMAVSSFDCIM